MVRALFQARLGSGGSRPNSKRIMKLTQSLGRLRSDSTTVEHSVSVSPYVRKMSRTSWASASGMVTISASSRARSLA